MHSKSDASNRSISSHSGSSNVSFYIPKHRYVSFGVCDTLGFTASHRFIKEIMDLWKESWERTSKFVYNDDDVVSKSKNKTSGFYAYHRGPGDVFKEHGYIRAHVMLSVFLNKFLNNKSLLSYLSQSPVRIDINSSLASGEAVVDGGAEDVAAAFKYFAESDIMDRRAMRNYKMNDTKMHAKAIANANYMLGDGICITIYNMVLFFVKQLHVHWFAESSSIKVNYHKVDMFDCIEREDFINLIKMKYNGDMIDKAIELVNNAAYASRDVFYTMNGAQMGDNFFQNFVDKLMEQYVLETTDTMILNKYSDEFSSLVVKAASYLRLAQNHPNLFMSKDLASSVISGISPSVLLYHSIVESVDVSETAVKDFLTQWKQLDKFVDLFDKFVDTLFIGMSQETAILPAANAYCAVIDGKERVYGMQYLKPDIRGTYFIDRYEDGDVLEDMPKVEPNVHNERTYNTKVVNEFYRGIDVKDLGTDDKFVKLLLDRNTYFGANSESLTSFKVNLSLSNEFCLLIPPSSRVDGWFFTSDIIPNSIYPNQLTYITKQVQRDEIESWMYPFIVSANAVERARNSEDSESKLDALFNTAFKSALNFKFVGVEHGFEAILKAKTAVLSLAAMLGYYNSGISESLLRLVEFDICYDSLSAVSFGNTFSIPSTLLIPFGYDASLSTSKQRTEMGNYATDHKGKLIIDTTSDNIYAGDDFIILLDEKVHNFTDKLKKGLLRVKVDKDRFITDNVRSFVSLNKDKITFNLITLLGEQRDSLIKSRLMFGCKNEQDYYYIYDSRDVVNTVFILFKSFVSDILLTDAHIAAKGTTNIKKTCVNFIDTIDYIQERFNLDDVIYNTCNHAIDKTWKELVELAQDAKTKASAYIDAFNAAIEAKDGSKDSRKAEAYGSFKRAFFSFLSELKQDIVLFWGSQGFDITPIFFGSVKSLLSDLHVGRSRTHADIPRFIELQFSSMPSFEAESGRADFKKVCQLHADVMLYNLLGKFLYGVDA